LNQKQDIKIAGVYKITNIINNKVYIGESLDIYRRWEEHIEYLNNNKHHSYKLQNDYNTYGLDSFNFNIIEELKQSDVSSYKNTMLLIYKENEYIKKYDSINMGYNIENTLEKVLSGEKVILDWQKDRGYLKSIINNNGQLPEKRINKNKNDDFIIIDNHIIYNKRSQKRIYALKGNLSLTMFCNKLQENGIVFYTEKKIKNDLCNLGILYFDHGYRITEEFLNKDIFVLNTETKDQKTCYQVYITDYGKQFLMDALYDYYKLKS